MTTPAAHAFYLSGTHEPVYALFDAPLGRGGDAAVGVLLCPLFGNDDLCSYRARREWARILAGDGRATLRIDLPGSGDSGGGPRDPMRLEAWTDAVAAGARWLRDDAGSRVVVAIGVGLGGLLSYRAASEGAPIDDLVLWSVPARGHTFVRHLRALSQMEAASAFVAELDDTTLPAGAIACAGFLLSAETVAELEALDLTGLPLANAAKRRVLLLQRDGIDADVRLQSCLERSGAAVTLAPGPGYGQMVEPPQYSRPPFDVFATVEAWLAADDRATPIADPGASRSPGVPSASCDVLDLTVGGARVRETPLTISHQDGRLLAVLAEGEHTADVCAVLLNAGALRRIGPGRMWVELARRWAARGVPTLRIDLAGIGESDGDARLLWDVENFYAHSYVEQTLEVLEALARRGLPERFVLAGLCSGAYWSLQAALCDERVVAAYMLNPEVMLWDSRIEAVRNARDARKVLRVATWRKLVRGQIHPSRMRDIASGVLAAARLRPRRSWLQGAQLEQALERLEQRGTQLMWVFTAKEPLLYELERGGGLAQMTSRSNVRVEAIAGAVTSPTLEPLRLQGTVHDMLDAALDRRLETLAVEDGPRGIQSGAHRME